MKLLEHQAKELFAEYGIPVPEGRVSSEIARGRADAGEIGYPLVVKAQVPVGGRGKAGGVQRCSGPDELELRYPQVMGMTIKGEAVRSVLLERAGEVRREMYLAVFLDRGRRCYTVIASGEGGVEVESMRGQKVREAGLGEVGRDEALGAAADAGLSGEAAGAFADVLVRLARLAREKEAELAEINPLAEMADGSLAALDGKVVTDDNSSFRHPELAKYASSSELEERAARSGFSLVELDGDVAVVGNGAGLVMSTLDMLSDSGGRPACFLDVGGGATTESVYEALELISRMGRVRAVLVNLYGGIVKTTTVSSALVRAYGSGLIDLPVYARLMGAESEEARRQLEGTKTRMYGTVEEAIAAAVTGGSA